MACEINAPTALLFLLATSSWIQATTAVSSMTGTSNSPVSPNSATTLQASVHTTNVNGEGSVTTISSKSSVGAQGSSFASGNVDAAATTSSVDSDSSSVAQVSTDVSSVKPVAATESGVKISSTTSNVVSVPSSSATTSTASNSSTVSQASKHNVSSVNATIVAVPGSSKTTSAMSVGVSSVASTGNTSINVSAEPTSIVTPQLSVSSAGDITQTVATATETTPALGASSPSAAPSLETSSKRSPEPPSSTADTVTGSANPQRTTTTVASSNGIGEQSQHVSATPTSPVPRASSTASVLATSSSLSPTLGLPSLSDTRSPPSQSSQARWSAFVSGQHGVTTVMTSSLEDSLTVSVSNSTSSASLPVNASSTSSANTSTPTPSQRPTFPPEGTKVVSIELSLDMEFKEEYNDPNSPEYKILVANLTMQLKNVYENVDGFVDIRILFIRKGSVICSYIVILARNSQVKEEKLKEVLEQAHKDRTFTFKVKSIEVEEAPTTGSTEKPEEKLLEWALITIIVLASLAFVLLVTIICVCVKYRRSVSGDNDAYYISSGDLGMNTYETVAMGDVKMRASAGGNVSTVERRLVGSHANPTYGSNGALAD